MFKEFIEYGNQKRSQIKNENKVQKLLHGQIFRRILFGR